MTCFAEQIVHALTIDCCGIPTLFFPFLVHILSSYLFIITLVINIQTNKNL